MLNEAAHLASIGAADVFSRTYIDERCLVISPIHQIANRILEQSRGPEAHGTCGLGVGQCVADSIANTDLSLRAEDLRDRSAMKRKLSRAFEFKRTQLASLRSFATAEQLRVLDHPSWLDVAIDKCEEIATRASIVPSDAVKRILRDSSIAIFEGAQGVLLDEQFGFDPHTTWSTTTFANADEILDEAGLEIERFRIGVIRTYMTRHGAGPLVTSSQTLRAQLDEPHNSEDGFQGGFRCGELDLVALRYAIEACRRVDALAVTHLDRLPLLPPRVCSAYEIEGKSSASLRSNQALGKILKNARPIYREWPRDEKGFVNQIQDALSCAVQYRSRGPTWREK
jgi:adenylosuccinate synthase